MTVGKVIVKKKKIPLPIKGKDTLKIKTNSEFIIGPFNLEDEGDMKKLPQVSRENT